MSSVTALNKEIARLIAAPVFPIVTTFDHARRLRQGFLPRSPRISSGTNVISRS